MKRLPISYLLIILVLVFQSSLVSAQSSAKGRCEVVLLSGQTVEGVLSNLIEKKGAVHRIRIRDRSGRIQVFNGDEIDHFKVKALNELTQRFEEVVYEHPDALPYKVKEGSLLKLMKSTENQLAKVYFYENGFKTYKDKFLYLLDDGIDFGMWLVTKENSLRFSKSTYKNIFNCLITDYQNWMNLDEEGLKFENLMEYLDSYDAYILSQQQ